MKVQKPRLRKKGQGKEGELEIPTFFAIKSSDHIGEHILDTLMCNVSTRDYEIIIDEIADTVGSIGFLPAEKSFNRISGYQDLWML